MWSSRAGSLDCTFRVLLCRPSAFILLRVCTWLEGKLLYTNPLFYTCFVVLFNGSVLAIFASISWDNVRDASLMCSSFLIIISRGKCCRLSTSFQKSCVNTISHFERGSSVGPKQVFRFRMRSSNLLWILLPQILGLTAGMCIGTYVHCTIYGILVFTTNWENQVTRCLCR